MSDPKPDRARHGCLCVVERHSSYHTRDLARHEGVCYLPVLATHVDRAGVVQAVVVKGVGGTNFKLTLKRKDFLRSWADVYRRVANPRDTLAQLVDQDGAAREYPSLAAAQAAIAAAAGLTLPESQPPAASNTRHDVAEKRL